MDFDENVYSLNNMNIIYSNSLIKLKSKQKLILDIFLIYSCGKEVCCHFYYEDFIIKPRIKNTSFDMTDVIYDKIDHRKLIIQNTSDKTIYISKNKKLCTIIERM